MPRIGLLRAGHGSPFARRANLMIASSPQPDVQVRAPLDGAAREILTAEALRFIAALSARFEPARRALLKRRAERKQRLDAGELPDFLPETRHVRESDWTVAPIPPDLHKRHVEITGPVERKMVINALNSGADCFMADFEDANSPTWQNVIDGQINLRDAIRRTIEFSGPEGKRYRLNDQTATLLVRPRGWHLDEKHVHVGSRAISASLFDFGLYFFHNARELIERGTGPYFYLPKLESHLEARLWNDVFVWSQEQLGIPVGMIRATVLIETILAAFEMDEILYELRDHSAGLNCGRWDYIFSLIKKLGKHERFVLSDRGLVTMTTPFMRAYSLLTIRTCHRRGIHAMGGMAAQIPIKGDAQANDAALAAVRDDKRRECADGHDGTWVAHPGLVPIAREEFAKIGGDNQVRRDRADVNVTAADLLNVLGQPAPLRGRHPKEHQRRTAVPRIMAARQRLRADQPPNGRRGHRGDLPRAALAVGAPPRAHDRAPDRHARTRRALDRDELNKIRAALGDEAVQARPV